MRLIPALGCGNSTTLFQQFPFRFWERVLVSDRPIYRPIFFDIPALTDSRILTSGHSRRNRERNENESRKESGAKGTRFHDTLLVAEKKKTPNPLGRGGGARQLSDGRLKKREKSALCIKNHLVAALAFFDC
ncbi:MAG: hypothetical protein KA537_00995 [Candidatus Moranbacteria bacterium]|nr:hypothetical protein [Candidatus Moranbacteria bacterium]